MLRSWADRLTTLPDDYIAHEFLEETNSPSTVRDFVTAAARHGLGYLSECELSSMIPDNYGQAVAGEVRTRSANDLVGTEQYLDLLSGRTFRQSLLIANDRMGQVNRALSPARIAEMNFVTPAALRVERDGESATVVDAAGRKLTTSVAAVRDGMERLVARYPASSTLADCIEGQGADASDAMLDALYWMVISGLIHVSSEPAPAGRVIGEHPKALALARIDAVQGASFTTNLRHETVTMDAAALALLPVMDGTRDTAALSALLVERAKTGQLTFSRDGKPVTDPKAVPAVVAEYLPQILDGIAGAGLIEN
jgi:hypothetical protein